MSTSQDLIDSARRDFFGHAHVTHITAGGRPLATDVREIWLYRDLLALLTLRDITVKYKQSAMGIAWAILQPLVLMATFTIVFGRLARLPSDGYPYPLFVLCALLPWQYFAKSLSGASGSLAASTHLVTKVYFPRLVLPLSRTLSGLVDFGITIILLGFVMLWYGRYPGWEIVLLPLFVVLAMMTALGTGLWLTALNVRYRDVGLLVPFIIQIWMYASPIAYSMTLVPEKWRWVYSLNPMAGVAEGFRWALLGKAPPSLDATVASVSIVLLIFAGGLMFFRHTEQTFADVI